MDFIEDKLNMLVMEKLFNIYFSQIFILNEVKDFLALLLIKFLFKFILLLFIFNCI